MLDELKKAFNFIINRKRPYRFYYFFAGCKGRKICKLIKPEISALPKSDCQKYFKGYNVLYWKPNFVFK